MLPTSTASNVYTDLRGLEDLKREARSEAPEAMLKVAKQFESLFMQMMLKSMRDAGISDGLLQNDQTRFYQDMHDKQLSLHLSDKTDLGLANLIAQQLGKPDKSPDAGELGPLDAYRLHPIFPTHSVLEGDDIDPAAFKETQPLKTPESRAAVARLKNSNDRPISEPKAFVKKMLPFAKEAAAELGVAPGVLIAQAALETGWGRSLLKHPNGESTNNLFNIKANGAWKGDRVSVGAIEFEDGVVVKQRATFRAYEDFGESFRDYVQLVKESPRYRQALQNAHDPKAYIQALQRAGYATDPHYAAKVTRIFEQLDMAAADKTAESGRDAG